MKRPKRGALFARIGTKFLHWDRTSPLKVNARGRKPIFLVTLGVRALSGAPYVVSDNPFWLVAVQALSGVGAGIFGALFPIVVADLTRGTGRFNAAQGAVATVQGVGASISALPAGVIIVTAGYSAGFVTLAAIAACGLVLYVVAMPETHGYEPPTDRGARPVPAASERMA